MWPNVDNHWRHLRTEEAGYYTTLNYFRQVERFEMTFTIPDFKMIEHVG